MKKGNGAKYAETLSALVSHVSNAGYAKEFQFFALALTTILLVAKFGFSMAVPFWVCFLPPFVTLLVSFSLLALVILGIFAFVIGVFVFAATAWAVATGFKAVKKFFKDFGQAMTNSAAKQASAV